MMKRTNILRELKKVNPVITEETNFQTILEIISSKSNSNNKFNFDKISSLFLLREPKNNKSISFSFRECLGSKIEHHPKGK